MAIYFGKSGILCKMSPAAAIGVIYQIILDFWPAFQMMDSQAAPVMLPGEALRVS